MHWSEKLLGSSLKEIMACKGNNNQQVPILSLSSFLFLLYWFFLLNHVVHAMLESEVFLLWKWGTNKRVEVFPMRKRAFGRKKGWVDWHAKLCVFKTLFHPSRFCKQGNLCSVFKSHTNFSFLQATGSQIYKRKGRKINMKTIDIRWYKESLGLQMLLLFWFLSLFKKKFLALDASNHLITWQFELNLVFSFYLFEL